MAKMQTSWKRWDREQGLFLIIVLVILGIFIALFCVVISEIEECGGVAQCLGEAARDFDTARGR